MKPRPTIFLSGVSHEFGSFRDAVENEIEKKGCFAENQPSFAPDYRTVEEMLRRKLHDADAVIHIVGFRFGAEPSSAPRTSPRRSYTQMEFDIAREMEKTGLSSFLSAGRDACAIRRSQSEEHRKHTGASRHLQLAHRRLPCQRHQPPLLPSSKHRAELCKLVAAIPLVAAG